ncbi:unnamed protein product [Owenia fusiformis]|uniref:Uncharacterized protein n=1 Tax=Owenia fusiformis TaxID=6347 RepID=A0A8J1UVP5_OWEFU|nr:unnamed protein product [Owenia fusiformis]
MGVKNGHGKQQLTWKLARVFLLYIPIGLLMYNIHDLRLNGLKTEYNIQPQKRNDLTTEIRTSNLTANKRGSKFQTQKSEEPTTEDSNSNLTANKRGSKFQTQKSEEPTTEDSTSNLTANKRGSKFQTQKSEEPTTEDSTSNLTASKRGSKFQTQKSEEPTTEDSTSNLTANKRGSKFQTQKSEEPTTEDSTLNLTTNNGGFRFQPQKAKEPTPRNSTLNLTTKNGGSRLFKGKTPNTLFYTRMPKCGSTTILDYLKMIQDRNDFQVYHYKYVEIAHEISEHSKAEETFLRTFQNEKDTSVKNLAFVRHIGYFNFTKRGIRQPLLIDMLRDPVERAISRFYFIRQPSEAIRRNLSESIINETLSQCIKREGKNQTCVAPTYVQWFNSYTPDIDPKDVKFINRAKNIIEKEYVCVGILEQLSESLTVFSKLIPQYFGGIHDYLKNNTKISNAGNRRKGKDKLPKGIRDTIVDVLASDYDIYKFAVQLFNSKVKGMNVG